MTMGEIKNLINTPDYDFLRTDPRLGDKIILLGLGGSHAYGTNIETSDVDIRGCCLQSKHDLLREVPFEQFTNEATDTVIYSFSKLINLLCNCNPNTIEILGLNRDQYIYLSPIGEELIAHKDLFISQRCIHTFGGYANQQLYKLQQLAKHHMDTDKLEQHILNTLTHMQDEFVDMFELLDKSDFIKLYIDKSNKEDMNTEIFMDVKLSHYPVRDYAGMWSLLQNTTRQYNQLGSRNKKALDHGKISKHMMHLVRLYHMCFDILERGEINTYRSYDHDELMEIRNGKYVDDNNQILPEFFEMVDALEAKLAYDKENTSIPKKADMNKIMDFKASIIERIIKEEI